MKITKRQLRRIIEEACALGGGDPGHQVQGVDAPADHYSAEVPVPEDYDRVRDFLSQNSDIADLGIGLVMDMAGAGCERSTAQGIIDHLKEIIGSKDPDVAPRPHHDPVMMAMPPL